MSAPNLASGQLAYDSPIRVEDMPSALRDFLDGLFPDNPLMQLRALVAPDGQQGFDCLWDHRHLWTSDRYASDPTRVAMERSLRSERDHPAFNRLIDADQVFFVFPGTGGTLRSPFAELSDAEFWAFVVMRGPGAETDPGFFQNKTRLLGQRSVLEFVGGTSPRSALAAAWRRLAGYDAAASRRRRLSTAWGMARDQAMGIYT